MDELTIKLIKLGVVIVAAPVWYPFAKALWIEFKESMREHGGLLGDPPSARQLLEIQREKARREDPLVHEPLAHTRAGRAPRAQRPPAERKRAGVTAVKGSRGATRSAALGLKAGQRRFR